MLRLCARRTTRPISSPTFPPIPRTCECALVVHSTPHIARLTLQRPRRRNAIGHVLLAELEAVLGYCRDTLQPRCLVVDSDVPGVFCSGADVKERHAMITASPDTTDTAATEAYVTSLRDLLSQLESLPFPTVSAIDGAALGGGLELALATDIRIAGADAVFGFPEASLGVMPGAGGTVRATALLGKSTTLELIYTAAPLTASEARERGVVNRVVPAGSATRAALQMAEQIARNSPLSLKTAKEAVNSAAEAINAGCDRHQLMHQEATFYRRLLASPDRAEGVAAFVEKRPPRFTT